MFSNFKPLWNQMMKIVKHCIATVSSVNMNIVSLALRGLWFFSLDKSLKAAENFLTWSTCMWCLLQGLKEFINEVNTLASLQHPHLCKLLGFHACDGSEPRMLVYERLCHGSLDRQLFGRSDSPSIDWNSRMKIAICAAQGLTFLHEEGPFQVMNFLFLA